MNNEVKAHKGLVRAATVPLFKDLMSEFNEDKYKIMDYHKILDELKIDFSYHQNTYSDNKHLALK